MWKMGSKTFHGGTIYDVLDIRTACQNDGVEIIAEIKAIAPLPRMLRSPTQSL